MSSQVYPRQTNPVWSLLAIVFAAAVAASFLLPANALPHGFPRLWTMRFLDVTALFFCLGMVVRGDALKSIMFSLMAVFLALGVGEAYLAQRGAAPSAPVADAVGALGSGDDYLIEFADELLARKNAGAPARTRYEYTDSMARFITDREELARYKKAAGADNPESYLPASEEYTKDPLLGYRPIHHAARIAAVKLHGDEMIYDATYTLLPSGWRTVPQHPEATEAVVFFGCSNTFGEGLNDAETYPYKVAERLGDKYQVFNFGFHGYGSHQMLAMIENGYLDDIAAKYDKLHVFFLTINGHELRSAGKSSWDQDGPAYEISGDGVKYKGSFSQNKSEDSGLALAHFGEQRRMLNLHLAIMKQADRDLMEKFHAHLNVIAWFGVDYQDKLQAQGTKTLDVTGLVGEDLTIKGDGHPNGRATTAVSKEIVEYILAKKDQ